MTDNAVELTLEGMKLVEAHFKMQLGITPSRGYVVMTGDQWQEPLWGNGDLTIADANTSVTIANLKIEKTRKIQGLEGTSLIRVELKDRRWKWHYRTFTGRYNVVISNNDGDVRYDPDTVKQYIPGNPPQYVLYSFDDIARDLLEGMGEQNVSQIPIESTTHTPLNKEWENENPAVALQEMCEEINFGIGLRVSDNRAMIVKIGSGNYPSLQETYKINEGAGITYHDKPDYVKVVGNRIQNEITTSLEAVGIDVDGEIRKLAYLAYVPDPYDPDDGTGFGKSALLGRPFSNITGGSGYTAEEAQALAEKSVFKYFRMPNTGLYSDDSSRANADLLPVLKTLNSLDDQGYRKRPCVKACYYQKAPAGGFENLLDPEPPRTSFRIDHRRGLVIFGKRVGTLLDPGVTILSDTKLVSWLGNVNLTFAYELKGNDDFYYYLKTDQTFPPSLSEAAILAIKRGDLTLRRVQGVNMNKSVLDNIADEIADAILAMSPSAFNADIRLAGAHNINPNGSIDSVQWSAKDAITTHLRFDDFEPPASPDSYEERTTIPRLLSYPEDNRRATYLAREGNLQGARQSGDISADEPGGIEDPSLEVINAHHAGVIIVKDSRPEAEKESTTYEEISFGEVTDIDSNMHRHILDNVGPLIDMRYNDHLPDWLTGWVHGSFIDVETTEFLGQNEDNWHHLGDNGGMGYVYPVKTRIYYGRTPIPDPLASDPAYHPSQGLDHGKPIGYVPGGVTDVNKIRIAGEMKSAPDMPTVYGVNVISHLQYSTTWVGLSTYLEFGAITINKTLTFFEVLRSPWDVNSTTSPHLETLGMWGIAEYVRFKVLIDPARTS